MQQKSTLARHRPRRRPLRWAAVVFLIGFCILAPAAIQEAGRESVLLPKALQYKAPAYPDALREVLNNFKRGMEHFSKEQYASALEAFPGEKEAGLTAVDDYILLYRAKSYLMLDQGKEALDYFRLLQRRRPESSLRRDALIGEGLSLLKVKEPKAAFTVLSSAELQQTSEILYYRGRALEEAAEKDKALRLYLEVYAGYPESSFSQQAIRSLLSISPQALSGRRNYPIRLQRAENLIKAGKATGARTLLLALAKVAAPDSKSSQKRLLLLGEAEYRRNKTAAALKHIRKVGAAHPELHSRAIYLEAACRRRLNDEASFISLRDKALKLYPQSPDTEELCHSAAAYYDVNYSSRKAWNAYRTLYQNFPKGKYAERALWKMALFPYFEGNYGDAASAFFNSLSAYPNPLAGSSAMYWMGRCYQKLGDFEHAKYLYARTRLLANESYYGQRALEAEDSLKKAGDDGKNADIALDFSKVVQACEKIRLSSAAIREPGPDAVLTLEKAEQLQQADLPDLALSELRWGRLRYPENEEAFCYRMSLIHENRRNYNESIAALRGAFPDYSLRPVQDLPEEIWRLFFPVLYWDVISVQAASANLDPKLILSLIRQESGFEEKARSQSDARGLMQILPSTGRSLARGASMRNFTANKLYQAETNITLGVRFLASLIRTFGKEELALAAYNAGPSRVDRWLKEFGDADMAEFVEQIPFNETRGYVKQVLSNKAHYNLLSSPIIF